MSLTETPHDNYVRDCDDAPVATVHYLRRHLTVALDPAQELLNIESGPVYSDEYHNLLLVDDPSDEQLARLSRLEDEQESLQYQYVSAWAKAATALAESRMITLTVNLGGSEDDGETAADFRNEVNSLIRVVYSNTEGWCAKF